ncbi:MAG: FRG domain-containing protein [Bdellovibrionales bacterium]
MGDSPYDYALNVFDEEFGEAKDVLDHFLSNDKFQTNDRFSATSFGKNCYVFRGHSNFKWPLLPSAFRPETDWSKFTPQPPNESQDTKRWLLNKLHSEAIAIKFFLETADAMGLTTPIDYLANQNAIKSCFDARNSALNNDEEIEFDFVYPPKDYYRSIALAQHFGVPTRFLDWSESPLVACYFAAKDASCISINRLKSSGMAFVLIPSHSSFQADGKNSSPAPLFL